MASGSISTFSEMSKILFCCSFSKTGLISGNISPIIQEYTAFSLETALLTEHEASFSSSPTYILIRLFDDSKMSSLAVPAIINLKESP